MENEGNAGTTSNLRWKPTKEQITLLENFYKQGIRTPSTDQIYEITGRLRAHGYIEGKNVFYWFQNRKAKQRQKKKHERITYFNHLLHKTSRFICHTPCSNVGCVSPYYLRQASDHHNQLGDGSNYMMIPSGGTITHHKKQLSDMTTTPARLSMSSSSLRFNRFDFRDHGYYNEGINVDSSGRKTLQLFPLQPLHAANDEGVGNSSFTSGHDSPGTCLGDGNGQEQPFIDFFSGGSSRFGNRENGL